MTNVITIIGSNRFETNKKADQLAKELTSNPNVYTNDNEFFEITSYSLVIKNINSSNFWSDINLGKQIAKNLAHLKIVILASTNSNRILDILKQLDAHTNSKYKLVKTYI